MQKMRRSKMIQLMNHQIERGWIAAKRLEGWTEKSIHKSIESLEHLKAAHQAMREEAEKQKREAENDGEEKFLELE